MIETKDLELKVQEQTQGSLLTNALQIRDFVTQRVQDYSPEKYAGNVKEAKDDRAVLNKAAKDLNTRRLELEREFMAPFQEFKDVIAETVNVIREASNKIGDVVSEVEEQERQERLAEIRAEYDASGFTLVPLEKLMDSKWLNKSTSRKRWQEELAEAIEHIQADLASLESVEYRDDAKALYLDTLDIGKALQHAQELTARREALKTAQPAPVPADAVKLEPSSDTQAKTEPEPGKEVAAGAALHTVALEFRGTREQLTALREYIDKQGIQYRKIPVGETEARGGVRS
ncbi:MAG: DUF1351 domain-containing protein [Alkalispirochaeta sp.]